MSTSERLTANDLLAIRKRYYEISEKLKNEIVFSQRELPQDYIDELWEEADAVDENIREIEDQIFNVIVVDIERPRQEIMKSIQKVEAAIKTLKRMNEGVDRLVKILKPFTTMMAIIFAPGSSFGIVKIADLIAQIEAVA